ncbi:MAG: hypothetical protein IJK40_01635, partial [Clostridia bacterium]|nr:hypothetical protein [Clostridia bacterium]
ALLDLYSVILHRFSLPTARLTASNLYNLTKKSTAQSAHRNYAVLPKVIKYQSNKCGRAQARTRMIGSPLLVSEVLTQ